MEVSTYLGSVTHAWMTESFGTAIRITVHESWICWSSPLLDVTHLTTQINQWKSRRGKALPNQGQTVKCQR